MPADGWWGWGLPLAVTAFAGLIHFWRITRPGSKIFDETYYATDSWSLLHHGVELDVNLAPKNMPECASNLCGFVVHPPLGKWMIAVGEAMWGNNPLGWRFSAAVVGTLAVLMIARIARRMFRSTVLGAVAGLLLSLDGLEFVQSRTSMLDIFLMFWVLAAFGALVLDRDQGRRRLAARLLNDPAAGERGLPVWWRPWRWACGICLGAAVATKWDGLFWIPLFALLAVWWDSGARRAAGARRPIRPSLTRGVPAALVQFFVVAAVVYLLSWTGWFVSDGAHAWDHDRYVSAGQSSIGHLVAVLGGWWRYHWEIYNFHAHLDAAHPYLSRPYGWLLLSRPVSYFYASPSRCGASTSCAQEVLGVGTPAIWWASILALVAVGWRAVARLDWRAAAIFLTFLAGYVPWFIEDGQHRTMFLFYLLPSVPFMVLAVTFGVGMVVGGPSGTSLRRVVGMSVAGVYLAGVLANFFWLYPVLSAEVITYTGWHDRMQPITWNCNAPSSRNQHHELAGCWI
jgi:dolichyl-phosphate-mannose-protein mannosyltransferase